MNTLLRLDMIPATPGPSFFVWLRDERGFLDSYVTAGDWKHYAPAKLLELVKAAHPARNVTWCGWAERPGDFTISGACLLVACAGERGAPIPESKPMTERTKPEPHRDYMHATAADVADRFDWRNDSGLRGIVARDDRGAFDAVRALSSMPVDTEHVATCCGISHTRASYRALEMISATERTEGFTVLLDEQRQCTCCKGVIAVTSKRLLGDRR